MKLPESKIELKIYKCSFCGGKAYKDGGMCLQCDGVGFWGEFDKRIIYARLPKIIKVDWQFVVLKMFRRVLTPIWISLSYLSIILLVWNIVTHIDYSPDFWHEFEFLGWRAPFMFAGLLSFQLYLFWFFKAKKSPNRVPLEKNPNTQKLEEKNLNDWKALKQLLPKSSFINVGTTLDPALIQKLSLITERLYSSRNVLMSGTYLLKELFQSQEMEPVLRRLSLSAADVTQFLHKVDQVHESPSHEQHLIIAQEIGEMLIKSFGEAIYQHKETISIRELWVAGIAANQQVREYLRDQGVRITEARQTVYWVYRQEEERQYFQSLNISHFKRAGKLDKGWTGGWTVTLDKYSRDLTKAARKGYLRRVVGREQEIENLARILSRSSKSNVAIVGEPGVGKTTLVEGLAHRIVEGEVASSLKDKRLVELNIGALMGSGSNAHQFSETLVKILEEIRKAKNVILFLNGIHQLQGTGGDSGELDAVAILTPSMARSEFQCISTSSTKEYGRFSRMNEEFVRVMEKVTLQEPSFDDAIMIIQEVVLKFERKNKVIVSYQALKAAISLSMKYIHDKQLPDKAIDLLDEACVLAGRRGKYHNIVTSNDIVQIIATKTNVPVTDITEEESDRLLKLEQILHERVVGQEPAVKSVASAIRRARVGLKDSHRPIANFLFVGPTGVGKTELAKALAEAYFGHENIMVRLDMSEFQEVDSIRRLLGAPPGSPGEGEGQLTEAIRSRPFAIILLDEFEKAHPDIHNVFLQVFDDGRLTDSTGRRVDFTNTIIIATSNAGAKVIQDGLLQKRSMEVIKEDLYQNVLPQIYRPELINRFDEVILFQALTQKNVFDIAGKMLKKIYVQLKKQDIEFKITDEAVEKIAELGYDPLYGARPLRRVIQTRIEDPIAGKILRSEVNRGDTLLIREYDI